MVSGSAMKMGGTSWIKTLRKMVYVTLNEMTDKLIEKYKNLCLIHGLNDVLRTSRMVVEKYQV